ncbi:MAG: heme-binding protein [Pseudomonadota bacterium]
MTRPPWAGVLAGMAALVLTACGGGTPISSGIPSTPPPPGAACTGQCASSSTSLTQADVQRVIAQAVAEAQARHALATIAVVDRVGNVLAVFRMNGAATATTIRSGLAAGGLENVSIVPDTLAAVAKAITAAYLSTEGNAFSTRTAGQLIQEHFNPGEASTPGGPLYGVQFSQLPCSDVAGRAGTLPAPGPARSPLGLAADPGGLPLYMGGTPVGGVGVVSDGIYGIDRNVFDVDQDPDEAIATAATFGLAAPEDRRADHITADGRTLRFADATVASLLTAPAGAPAFASIDGVAGQLVAVTGYAPAATRGGLAFGTPASGLRADTSEYPGLDAYVLVDAADAPRYPPRAGTEASGALDANEVRELLREALGIANRTRAQIRRPLGSQARVTISVVDSQGVILGVASTRDPPLFGIDVSVQKARTSAFMSSTTAAAALAALPDAVHLAGGLVALQHVPLGGYVSATRSFLGMPSALGDGSIAWSSRAIGNLSRPFYPDGTDGAPPGPLSTPIATWSPFNTGLGLDLVYNALIQHVGYALGVAPDVGQNCTGVGGFDADFAPQAPVAGLANGIQVFPGGVPIYRGQTLVGAIGVSGDGVDQDDMIALLGVDGAARRLGGFGNAPVALRSDTLSPHGARLRYVGCPTAPFLDSNAQDACNGR